MVNFSAAILTLKMEEHMQHFFHIMIYCFKKGKNATEMQKKKKKICAVCGEGAVIENVRHGFLRSLVLLTF